MTAVGDMAGGVGGGGVLRAGDGRVQAAKGSGIYGGRPQVAPTGVYVQAGGHRGPPLRGAYIIRDKKLAVERSRPFPTGCRVYGVRSVQRSEYIPQDANECLLRGTKNKREGIEPVPVGGVGAQRRRVWEAAPYGVRT